jgi:cell division protein FtsI/penicillin-binding protein 2
VVNMARLYSALATDGEAAQPEVARRKPVRTRILSLSPDQMDGLRAALAGVVSSGTAQSAAIHGVVLAGKTGTAQNSQEPEHDHAWFVGFAPADDPKIVVAVMLEFGGHGPRAANIASSIIKAYLKVEPTRHINTEG